MKRENFFTRLFAKKVNDQVMPEINEAEMPRAAETISKSILSFTPDQEEQFTAKQKVELQEKLEELPPLRIGEINFAPYEVGTLYGGYFVRVFIRHGRDLNEDFTLPDLKLGLIDATGDKVAEGFFRPQNFGTIRFGEARIWTFAFRPEQVIKQNADLSRFTISF